VGGKESQHTFFLFNDLLIYADKTMWGYELTLVASARDAVYDLELDGLCTCAACHRYFKCPNRNRILYIDEFFHLDDSDDMSEEDENTFPPSQQAPASVLQQQQQQRTRLPSQAITQPAAPSDGQLPSAIKAFCFKVRWSRWRDCTLVADTWYTDV